MYVEIKGFSRYKVNKEGLIIRSEVATTQFQPSAGRYVNVLLPERLIKAHNSERYSRVSLVDDFGNKKTKLVHRLVAEAFIENHENKDFVNHIDSNTHNNHVGNLEWCTHSENMIHAIDSGRKIPTEKQKQCGKEMIKNAIKARIALNQEQVAEVRELLAEKVMIKTIAEKYKVSIDTISRIKHRKSPYAS